MTSPRFGERCFRRIKEVSDKSETLSRYYRKSIKDIRAANACAEAVLWSWVPMGEIVNGAIGGKGRPNKKLAPECKFSKDLCDEIGVSRRLLSNYQLAARLHESANFDARLVEYRADEAGHNLALMIFLADIRRLLRREERPPPARPSDDWRVCIDEDGNVLDGHTRLRIRADAPTRVIRGLTDGQKKAFVLRSNNTRRNLSPSQKAEQRKKMKVTAAELRVEDAKLWTQAKVAVELGVSRQCVTKWFSDNTPNATGSNGGDSRVTVPKDAKPALANPS